MCGIFFSLSTKQHVEPSAELLQLLQQRGPDAIQQVRRVIHISHENVQHAIYLTFISTVLALRGSEVVIQPYTSPNTGSVLCWNGEAWLISGSKPEGNDTACVFEGLERCDNESKDILAAPSVHSYVHQMATTAGPFAMAYFNGSRNTILFGRDCLGRRSLLWSINTNGDFLLSSVSTGIDGRDWHEVEADGLYSIQLHDLVQNSEHKRHDWDDFNITKRELPNADSVPISVVPNMTCQRSDPAHTNACLDETSPAVSLLEDYLRRSLTLRITNIPSLSSSAETPLQGTQSRLAILFSGGVDCTLLARIVHEILPLDQSVDLLNVAFENPRVYKASIHSEKDASPYELCPDRITGRASMNELRYVCPNRLWRFVAIDVPYSETLAHREKITQLMHPHKTEMDLSISCALYFAARGRGVAEESHMYNMYDYTTPARVLVSGLGADELFAGYTRHATAYRRGGQQGLLDELALDIGRLGKRNLGRDDRVISHWSKEVRFPYLDESLVQWAVSTPVHELCGFTEAKLPSVETPSVESGARQLEPGKKVLRCLAWKLNMVKVSGEKKRAVNSSDMQGLDTTDL